MIRDGIIYKVCISCKEELPRGLFSKNNHYADGWSGKCKRCSRTKKTKGIYRDKNFAKKQIMRYGHAKI